MDARESMVNSAVTLLAEHGYQGTSFSAVLRDSGAPRGSVYHHFPGGKDELVAAALARTIDLIAAVLEPARGQAFEEVLERFGQWWRSALETTDCTAGCPLVAVSSGIGPDSALLSEVQRSFTALEDLLVAMLRSCPDIAQEQEVRPVAIWLIGAYEGAIAYGRATRSLDKFDIVSDGIRSLVRTRLG